MAAFVVTTLFVIIAVILIYVAVKKWFQDDYVEDVSGKPSALYDPDIPEEEFDD